MQNMTFDAQWHHVITQH